MHMSLASTLQMPLAAQRPPSLRCDNQKCLWTLLNVSGGGGQNHPQLRVSDVDVHSVTHWPTFPNAPTWSHRLLPGHSGLHTVTRRHRPLSHRHKEGNIQCYFLSLREIEEEPRGSSSHHRPTVSVFPMRLPCFGLSLPHVLFLWAFLVSNARPLGLSPPLPRPLGPLFPGSDEREKINPGVPITSWRPEVRHPQTRSHTWSSGSSPCFKGYTGVT